jgi:hypothetical protein|nr:MAG TPA: ATPase [Caudoviricetes sp.]
MEWIKPKRIMFVGPSGIGKTTLAKAVEEICGIPFISGSMSDLLPATKDITHSELLSLGSKSLQQSDYQLLTLRNRLFRDKETFVTDRSYADLAAYFWYKQDRHLPECELEDFFCKCGTLMRSQCDLAIYLPLSMSTYKDWNMEDNHKRITNRYYQVHISGMMGELLADWEIPTLVIPQLDLNTRLSQIKGHLL